MAREVDVACAVHGDAVAVVCSGATDISKQGHPGCDIRGRSQKCNADNQGESHSTQSIRYGAKRRSLTEQNAAGAESPARPSRFACPINAAEFEISNNDARLDPILLRPPGIRGNPFTDPR